MNVSGEHDEYYDLMLGASNATIDSLKDRIAALEKDKRDAWELLNDVCSEHADKDSGFYNNCETPNIECVWCFNAKKLKPVEA